MDYFIIVATTVAGLYFHWWLYVRIKRWMDRDLALSLANGDEPKKPLCCGNWPALGSRKSNARICRVGLKPPRPIIPISRLFKAPGVQGPSRCPVDGS